MTDGRADGDRIATSVEGPSAADAASTVEAAMGRGRVVSLVGECEVDVPGRAGATSGTRLVLLKPDGSVVVHGGDGSAPAVELTGTRDLSASVVEGGLEIAVGADGADGRLRFERVDLLASAAIAAAPEDAGAEHRSGVPAEGHETIRERLLADPDRVESGFRPLSTERETAAGPVDLYGRDAQGRAVVVEVKAHRAGPAAVGQLDRYVSALRRDLHADAEVRGVLVAPSATERTRNLLEERGFSFRALSTEG